MPCRMRMLAALATCRPRAIGRRLRGLDAWQHPCQGLRSCACRLHHWRFCNDTLQWLWRNSCLLLLGLWPAQDSSRRGRLRSSMRGRECWWTWGACWLHCRQYIPIQGAVKICPPHHHLHVRADSRSSTGFGKAWICSMQTLILQIFLRACHQDIHIVRRAWPSRLHFSPFRRFSRRIPSQLLHPLFQPEAQES